jgi:hypothetical protein
MATKKQTTKRDDAADLARHISAILNNPATPVCIYNDLADTLCSLDAPKGYWDSVEHIRPIIANNMRKGAKSKRG